MAADTDHFDALDTLADTHQKRLAESLVTLENRIADLVATAPLQDGKLFDLEWAVNARNELRQAINEDYLTEVDSIIRDYDQVAVDAATMLGEYGDIVQLDQDVIGQLQQMTFQGFEDLGAEHLDIISKQVYESTLTGATFANSVNAVREVVGKDMARYASQQVHDSLMQFDRAVNTKIALDSGATRFKYRGSDDEKTRTFCRKHVDKIYTVDEINEIWQGEWAGKSSSNAFATAGGYNCRHRFRPVFDDELEAQQVDEQQPEVKAKSDKKPTFDVKDIEFAPVTFKDKETYANKMSLALGAVTEKQLKLQNKAPKVELFTQEINKKGKDVAYYQPYYGKKRIICSPTDRDGGTARHEYGHHIDFELGKLKSGRIVGLSAVDDGFKKAHEQDRKLNKLIKSSEKDENIKRLRLGAYDVEVKDMGAYVYNKETIKNLELAGYSDIIDSLTNGYMRNKFGGYGHGKSYYKRKDARYQENFANLYALRSTKHWDELVVPNFPNMAKRFDEMIDEGLEAF